MRPYHLIITVGTSLAGNLRQVPELAEALRQQDTHVISTFLSKHQPTERICGAELNSTFQLFEQQQIQSDSNLYLCVSDTQAGQWIGAVLKGFLQDQGLNVSLYTIEGLQDQDPQRFSREGLRNLIRLCGKIIQQAGGPEYVALNATGGYKAQIAVAALLGSAMGIPVFYKHEQFDSVIGFPPMPVSMDDKLIEKHLGYMLAAEAEALPQAPAEEALLAFLDEERLDGTSLYALSPLGQICLTSYEQRYPLATILPPPAEKKAPRLRDDHYPKGFEAFVQKVWQECPYIQQCVSLPYDRQGAIRDRHFYTSLANSEDIIGEYRDKDGFGGRFLILTTASSPRQRQAVVRDLSRRYAG